MNIRSRATCRIFSFDTQKRLVASATCMFLLASLSANRSADAATERVLHTFGGGSDGASPNGGLVEVNGTFYGVTEFGGTNNLGTVYSITPDGEESVIHSFVGGNDGSDPDDVELVSVHGLLYGTTVGGGSYGRGTVFSVSTSGTETVLYSFRGGADGDSPVAGLTKLGNKLYGTTTEGGDNQCLCGTVFAVSLAGQEKTTYAFQGNAYSQFPGSALTAVNGILYGTTFYGGDLGCGQSLGCGTVYSVTPRGDEEVLHVFTGVPDGAGSEGNLLYVDGLLWGTTAYGGKHNGGAVFSISNDGNETIVGSFGRSDYQPIAKLVKVGDKFYGVSYYGGDRKCERTHLYHGGCGSVFSLSRHGDQRLLYSFEGGSDGIHPSALNYNSRTFYGTTFEGGGSANCSNGCGTVFALTL